MHEGKEVISTRQLTAVSALYIIGSAILYIPSMLASLVKQDAWIGIGIATLLSLILVSTYVNLSRIYPDKDFIDYCQIVFGRWLGKLAALIFLIFPLVLTPLLLWDIGDFMVTQVMPETPIQAFFILFIVSVIYGVRHGIESIVRTAEIFLPWVLGLFLITIILLVPETQPENIKPVFEKGFPSQFVGTYLALGFPFYELIVFLMILKHVNKKEKVKKSFVIGVFIGGMVLTIATFFCILVLGADFTGRNTFPVYVLGKKVSVGGFIERIEVFIAVIWFLSIYFKLAINFYVLCIGLAKVLSVQDFRVLTLPMGMLSVTLSLIMVPNAIFAIDFMKYTWTGFAGTFAIIFPALVYVGIKVKKKKKADKIISNNTT